MAYADDRHKPQLKQWIVMERFAADPSRYLNQRTILNTWRVDIPKAPRREWLHLFGGPYDINEYRQRFARDVHTQPFEHAHWVPMFNDPSYDGLSTFTQHSMSL